MDIRTWLCKKKQNTVETPAEASSSSSSNDIAEPELNLLAPPAADVTPAASTVRMLILAVISQWLESFINSIILRLVDLRSECSDSLNCARTLRCNTGFTTAVK
uniref:Uncharacterized protein n=1 Tax=Anguilla anguilla TaxID=7936 RepID=A0A0E9XP28_ANGAN